MNKLSKVEMKTLHVCYQVNLPMKVLSQLMPPMAYPNDPPSPAMMVNVLSPSA